MDVHGALHPILAADILGIAECIARGSQNRVISDRALLQLTAKTKNDFLIRLSFALQRWRFAFFDSRLRKCA